ncbi:MAG TPA: aminotransferase class III-fold pyridoxal phosphate-dependent enzyme [Pseudonocardiaceae bacterium]|nr:aminotransferase class III-fold pyridoxal phosphate-dependent enzyme [Pseudonocardiaceae bacterium]
MFDSESYRAWHGTAPMADFFRVSDPGMFLVSGTDCTVRDQAGREYLDARSSMWNVTLGYSCEPVKAALHAQIDMLPSGTVMRYEHPTAIAAEYASRLADCLPSPLDYIRFGNTGSQMTEAAAMLSRFYRLMTGEAGRDLVITVTGSYHGTGPLATALTGEPVLQKYSGPLDRLVRHVDTPPEQVHDPAQCDGSCVAEVTDLIEQLGADQVTAVMVEPVLGTFVRPVPLHYLDRLTVECRARGIHVIADEVTTGVGRAGGMTVSERLTHTPDMLVLGKGLSAGYFPLAALAVSRDIYTELARSEHRIGFLNGSTTDGHPLGMAAGLAVLELITKPDFFPGVREAAAYLRDTLTERLADEPAVGTVGGEGMMLGVALHHPDGTGWSVNEVNRLRLACRDHRLLTSFSLGVLPLLPPLTISRSDCGVLADRLREALHAVTDR